MQMEKEEEEKSKKRKQYLTIEYPLASSTKLHDKSTSKQMHVGPTFKYEFVQLVADDPVEQRRHTKMVAVADVGFTKTTKVLSPQHKFSPAMDNAKLVEANLSPEHHSFIKEMTPTDVTQHFYMLIPRQFSRSHLPIDKETVVILEDEKGKQYKTKYLPKWSSFSAGWRHFTLVKSLRERDVLVFHLVKPCKFKVYILRPDDFDPADKDLVIPKPREIHLKRKRVGETPKDRPIIVKTNIFQEDVEAKNSILEKDNSLAIATSDYRYSREMNLQNKRASEKRKDKMTVAETNIRQEDLEANNSFLENHDPLITPDIRFSKTISSLRNFKIIVENKIIDPEITKQTRASYFNLCSARKTLLHRHVIKGIEKKLVASIISETTNIADAIKHSKMSTPKDDVTYWNMALQSFEFFGMDVGFIRARLDRLLGISQDFTKAISNLKKTKTSDNKSKVARIEKEIREYQNKVEELKTLKKKVEIMGKESTDEILETFKVMYKEEAKAPWLPQ